MTSIIRTLTKKDGDATYFVPCFSTASSSFLSSSDDQPPLETIDAMVAHHLFLQSLFVRPGTCLAIECHFEGRSVWGSSTIPIIERRVLVEMAGYMLSPSLIAARSMLSSSFVHDRRSRTRMMSDPKSFEVWKESDRKFTREKTSHRHDVL